MANDLFREIVSIIRGYTDPFFAQLLLKKGCEQVGTTPDDLDLEHLPSLLLIMATDSQLLGKIKEHQFSRIAKKVMAISNRQNDQLDHSKVREIVDDYKRE